MNLVKKSLLGTPYAMFVPTNDVHGLVMTEHAADDGLWDLFLSSLAPGDIVLDIGAHIGLFSLWASAKGARVCSFEPAPINLYCLHKTNALNPGLALMIVPKAVSDHSSTVEFTPDGPYGHITNSDRANMPRVAVETVSVDEWIEELGLSGVKFVKIDVEGHEIPVLRGMRRLLSTAKPMLLCESNGHTLHLEGLTPSDLRREIQELGYESFRLHKGKVVPAPVDEIQPGNVTDLLCVPSGRAFSTNPRLTEAELEAWIAEAEEISRWPHLQRREEWTDHLKRELARYGL